MDCVLQRSKARLRSKIADYNIVPQGRDFGLLTSDGLLCVTAVDRSCHLQDSRYPLEGLSSAMYGIRSLI